MVKMKNQNPQPLDLDLEMKIVEQIAKAGLEADMPAEVFDRYKEVIKITLPIIKQRLKSACEFYLRYKDNPELLMKEYPEYKNTIIIVGKYVEKNLFQLL